MRAAESVHRCLSHLDAKPNTVQTRAQQVLTLAQMAHLRLFYPFFLPLAHFIVIRPGTNSLSTCSLHPTRRQ